MTLEEMREVLAIIASYDGRSVDAFVITEWHNTAAGMIPVELARAAARSWYSFNTGYMKPAHLIAEAAELGGHTRPDSVTARRLDGRELPFGHEQLQPMMNLEGNEHP